MSLLRIRYFAAARERVGLDEESLPVAVDVAALRVVLAARHPNLAPLLPVCRFGVNDAFATDATALRDNDDVVVLPPASGGGPRAQLLDTPLGTGQAEALCETDGVGGIATFVGLVRKHNRGKTVVRLEYSAYAPMAIAEMEAIAAEALETWPLLDVRILHRVGTLEIGDIAVQIAVASAHRGECFDACRWVIDALKARVPIWKRELTDDGAEWLGSTP